MVGPMSYWFRLGGHPEGLLPHHEFAVDGELVYPRTPMRCPRPVAWFAIDGPFVFPVSGHPAGPADVPWYEILGSFVYPADGHPDGPRFEPRYQARPTSD